MIDQTIYLVLFSTPSLCFQFGSELLAPEVGVQLG